MNVARYIASVIGAGVLAGAWMACAQDGATSEPPHIAARVPEGTEFHLRLENRVSSKTSSAGDRFHVTMTSPTTLPDGTVIPAGYRGVGEVIDAQPSNALGSAGGLSVKLNYISIGEARVRLRGAQAVDGRASLASAAAMSLLTGIGGIFVHGHDVQLDPGQALIAFADEEVSLPLPLAPPS